MLTELTGWLRINPSISPSKIRFRLGKAANVDLAIYSINGVQIFTSSGSYPSGSHEIIWNGYDDFGSLVTNGVYLGYLLAKDSESGVVQKSLLKIAVLK